MTATDEHIDHQGEDVVVAPCVRVACSEQSMEER